MNIKFNTSLIVLAFTIIYLPQNIFAQITIDNASFEGVAEDATMPTGWHSCKEGTTPDILPGPWGVIREAFDGDTYLGLITRENGTWESIEQRLSAPMKAGECYSFNLKLAYTKKYAGYDLPLKLRVWGCETKCNRSQLLNETRFIKHSNWREYEMEFYPKKDINYIILEAHFADGVYISYKGNILLDDLSDISRCDRASLIQLENIATNSTF